jgi:hypothetical protein
METLLDGEWDNNCSGKKAVEPCSIYKCSPLAIFAAAQFRERDNLWRNLLSIYDKRTVKYLKKQGVFRRLKLYFYA